MITNKADKNQSYKGNINITQEIIISVKNLCKVYGQFIANDNLTFDVSKGEIFGFLGANGAGKTTAIKILCGLSLPTSGDIHIAGFDIYKETEKIKKNIGYMSQRFSLYEDLTIIENVQFYGGIYGLNKHDINHRFDKLVDKLAIGNAKKRLVRDLPLGWKQKLAFSVAVFHEPKIVFLDEPTGGGDPLTRRQFWEMIYEEADKGITIFVTTHYMDEAEYCDRISIMSEGKIVAIGEPIELKKIYKTLTINEMFLKIVRNKN